MIMHLTSILESVRSGTITTYRFLIIKSENNLIEVNSIMETKKVDFFENVFLMKLSGEETNLENN